MNTTGLTQCSKCGEWYGVGDFPFCTPTSGHSKGFAQVSGDECDYIDHNLGRDPIRITSWSQRRQLMAERGLIDYQYDVPVPDDMAPNTQRPTQWGKYRRCDPEFLAWLGERLSSGKAEKVADDPPLTVTIREWVSDAS